MNELNDSTVVQTEIRVVLLVLGSPLVGLIFCFNVMLMILVCKISRLQNSTTVIIVSWATVDLVAGMVLLLQMVLADIRWTLTTYRYLCLFWSAMNLFPLIASSLHLTLLAFDRYMAVMLSLQYHESLSTKKLKLYLICSWLYAFFITIVTFWWHTSDADAVIQCGVMMINTHYFITVVILHWLPCIALSTALYVKVFLHVRRHERQVHVTHTLTQEQFVADRDLAKIFVSIGVLFVVTWLPLIFSFLVRLGPNENSSGMTSVVTLCLLLGTFNSAIKIIVYFCRHNEMRSAIRDMVFPKPPVASPCSGR